MIDRLILAGLALLGSQLTVSAFFCKSLYQKKKKKKKKAIANFACEGGRGGSGEEEEKESTVP